MFAGMGFSNQRQSPVSDGAEESTGRKRLELLPEEALFLIERGSMYCWRANDGDNSIHEQIASAGQAGVALEEVIGTPMSVQQAFAEMIYEARALSLEEYQVFAYLKRLGYTVLRAQKPSGAASYPSAGHYLFPISSHPLTIQRIAWLQPLCQVDSPLWWPRHSSTFIFKKLRVIPAGRNAPLLAVTSAAQSPYRPMYHVYKPSTPFKKTAPPPPDFYITVVKARSTPLPTLLEMRNMFANLPLSSPLTVSEEHPAPTLARNQTPSSWMTWFTGTLSSFMPGASGGDAILPIRPPNPFHALKAGRKSFVVAAVSGGNISFIKFSEGTFEEWPMI
ncbi:tRNA-splicing endonuclease subunit sen54 [Tulasnella sp. 331]|nr:tRNA-splicing endonuclease subunit sen54 [Tulasnella sp. 331]